MADGRHPGLAHARHVGHGQRRNRVRIAVEGPIADDLAHPVVQIDAGRKTEIDAHRAQFGGHQPAHRLRQRKPLAPVLVVAATQERAWQAAA